MILQLSRGPWERNIPKQLIVLRCLSAVGPVTGDGYKGGGDTGMDDEDDRSRVHLKMISLDSIFNTQKQITEVRSVYRSTTNRTLFSANANKAHLGSKQLMGSG